MGKEKEEVRIRDVWTVSTDILELSAHRNMKSVTELAGGEMCLPQRHHN